MKSDRVTQRFSAIALLLLVAGPPAARANTTEIEVELAGMMGLIPAEDGDSAMLVLVNAVDPALRPHGLMHRPLLEIYCEQLTDMTLREACRRREKPWIDSPFQQGVAAYPLDRGFDIRLLDEKGDPATKPLTGLASVKMYQPEMSSLGAKFGEVDSRVLAKAEKTTANKLRELAVSRVELRSGVLSLGEIDRRKKWDFVTQKGVLKLAMTEVLATIEWVFKVQGSAAMLELAPYDESASIRLSLAPSVPGHAVRLAVLNSPSVEEFCAHEPSGWSPVFHHFSGYYRLVPAAAMVDWALPVYRGDVSPCAEGGFGARPPIICMLPRFDAAEIKW